MKKIIVSMLLIISILFSDFFYEAISIFNKKVYLNDLNDTLIVENNNLIKKINQLEDTLELKKTMPSNYIVAKIIFRDIYDFYNKITINKGSKDNIKIGNVVLVKNSLLGIVEKVNKTTSEVKLLTGKLNVSFKINDGFGSIKSTNNSNDIIIGQDIDSKIKINIGDLVYTSGYGIIPEDILIGQVVKVKTDSTNLSQIIEIKPSINLNNIYYCYIIGEE